MLRAIVKFVLLAEAFAVVTFAAGWAAVPVLAFVVGIAWRRESHPVRYATWCATAGWLELLLLDAARGPLGALAVRFAGVMRVPSFVLLALTLIFPALLAWSSATIAMALRDRFPSSEKRASPVGSEHDVNPNPPSARGVAVADV